MAPCNLLQPGIRLKNVLASLTDQVQFWSFMCYFSFEFFFSYDWSGLILLCFGLIKSVKKSQAGNYSGLCLFGFCDGNVYQESWDVGLTLSVIWWVLRITVQDTKWKKKQENTFLQTGIVFLIFSPFYMRFYHHFPCVLIFNFFGTVALQFFTRNDKEILFWSVNVQGFRVWVKKKHITAGVFCFVFLLSVLGFIINPLVVLVVVVLIVIIVVVLVIVVAIIVVVVVVVV